MIVQLHRIVGMNESTSELVPAFQVFQEDGGVSLARADLHPTTYGAIRRHLALIERLLAETNPEDDNIEDATIISREGE